MSKADIIRKVEKLMSDILSRKHDAKITLRFGENKHGDNNESEVIYKE